MQSRLGLHDAVSHAQSARQTMTASTKLTISQRATSLALAGLVTLTTIRGASAEDGVGGFLQSIFGGGSAGQKAAALTPAPSPQQSPGSTSSDRHSYLRFANAVHGRPLTVRLRKAATKIAFTQSPTKPGKVSIYEDRTLRRGDAVMTAEGVRVFIGSSSWPYAAGDFVALTTAKNLNKDTVKVLAEVDRLPRN